MTITGFTADSTANGINVVNSAKTGLSGATIINDHVSILGSGRLVGELDIDHSQIQLFNVPGNGGGNPALSAQLSYSGSSTTSTSTLLRVRNQSQVFLNAFNTFPSGSYTLLISEISDSALVETNTNSLLLYLQSGGVLKNASIRGIQYLEPTGPISVFSNVSLINTKAGLFNWGLGRLDLVGLSVPSSTSGYVSGVGQGASGNSLHLWNPGTLDLAEFLISSSTGNIYGGYTASYKFIDSSGLVTNALLIYRDNRSGSSAEIARYTTNSSGLLTGTVNSKNGTAGSDIVRPTLWIRTQQSIVSGTPIAQSPQTFYTFNDVGGQWVEYPYTLGTVTASIEVRSYLHLAPASLGSPSGQIGVINSDESVAVYAEYLLLVDEGVTVTNTATVGGYSGISNSTGAFTLSGTLTLSQVYDSRKLYWRNNDGSQLPTKDGTIARLGSANITFSGSTASPAATAKFDQFSTTGTITLGTASSYTRIAAVSGTVINVDACGSTLDLSDLSNSFDDGTVFRITDGGSTTISVANSTLASQLNADKNQVSGTITFTTAPATVSVSVAGPSDYYVTIIQSGSRLNTSDTGIQSGTYSFTTSASGSAIVRVRRQGWRDFQTTITLTSGATATVGVLLTQELDGAGSPLYTGMTSTLITITVDGSDAAHKINWTGNGTATAQLVYDEVQDAKVSAAGMLVTGLQANYISFVPFLAAIVLPSTVKFRNQTPANLNCVFEGFAVQSAGALIDDTSGNGFIRVVASLGLTSQQSRDSMLLAPTTGATVNTDSIDDLIAGISAGSGLTAQQVRDALKLAPTAGSPAAGSVDADLDTLVARNNPLDAAGTRTAVGLASANLDTQLGAIDTVVDAILVDTDATIPAQITARTLAAADYFDPAADTVANVTTVGTVTSRTGYSLTTPPLDATATQAAAAAALTAYDPPTRAELTGDIGTVTTAIADVPTVAEFEARTLPSADYFVVGDYTAPDNGSIAAILEDTATTIPSTLSGLLTSTAYTSSLPANFSTLSINGSGQVPSSNMRGTDGALTSLGTNAPTGWINSAAIASDAISEIQAGLSTFDSSTDSVNVADKTGFSLSSGGVQAIWSALTSALTTNGSVGKFIVDQINTLTGRNNPLDSSATQSAVAAAIAAANLYDGSDTPGTITLLERIAQAPPTAQQIWQYSDRLLTGTQAANLAAIPNIPTNPLLTNDSRVDAIKAKTDQLAFSGGDIVATLAGEEVVVSTAGINAIVAGINGALAIPTAVQIRTEIDNNSTQLAAIKSAANAAKALSAAAL
jgi:hypothetical protein